MRKRSRARECALQVLYQTDITRGPVEAALEIFWRTQGTDCDGDLRVFCTDIVKGVLERLPEIDAAIAGYAQNWQLDRMAVVDRNILRMGCYELVCRADIPPKVTINESVELAKRYSGSEAGKFVNAILDKIRIAQGR
jgi:N utilization substance protein B